MTSASHGNLHITKRKEDKDDHLKVVLKDDIISFEIKIVGPDFILSYGRFMKKDRKFLELLFIVQADGKKIVDPIDLVNRRPDIELVVANPGRWLVFYNIPVALKLPNIDIFLAEISRHLIGGREWEVYRVLSNEGRKLLMVDVLLEKKNFIMR
uniref:ACT domain-containing protein n=1 Tax=Lactuca sativa TaxID=4236 RepID=A0A9R1XSH5_LACSA|nr:hypothetical protein LSAT_V11C100046000 [Lactuca sativa]